MITMGRKKKLKVGYDWKVQNQNVATSKLATNEQNCHDPNLKLVTKARA
jgi:hypothetical protein